MIVWALLFLLMAWGLASSRQRSGMLVVALAYLATRDLFSLAVLLSSALSSYLLMRFVPRIALPLVVALVVAGMAVVRLQAAPIDTVTVPLYVGLSYYGLRIIHVARERARGRLQTLRFADYLQYLAFLPALVAGPIHEVEAFLRDGNRRRWTSVLAAAGLERILYGAVKVLFLGNWCCGAWFLPWIRNHPEWPLWIRAYLECVHYGANLYFQFSGYSDLAIGAALLAGYRLPENFDWPFLARNINEFWQRWHMSLTRWCREYVFMPVIATSRSPYLAAALSMVVLGLWHEFSPRYLVWGLYQATGIVTWHLFRAVVPRLPNVSFKGSEHLLSLGSRVLTLNFVILSFAVTKEQSLERSWIVLSSILTLRGS